MLVNSLAAVPDVLSLLGDSMILTSRVSCGAWTNSILRVLFLLLTTYWCYRSMLGPTEPIRSENNKKVWLW